MKEINQLKEKIYSQKSSENLKWNKLKENNVKSETVSIKKPHKIEKISFDKTNKNYKNYENLNVFFPSGISRENRDADQNNFKSSDIFDLSFNRKNSFNNTDNKNNSDSKTNIKEINRKNSSLSYISKDNLFQKIHNFESINNVKEEYPDKNVISDYRLNSPLNNRNNLKIQNENQPLENYNFGKVIYTSIKNTL